MFKRSPVINIVDKQRPTESKTVVEDVAINTSSEIFKIDMDAIRQTVRLWVYCNYGDRLDDFYYGSNLNSLVGLLPDEVYEKIGSIDLFWDRMEREVKIVKVSREKSYLTIEDNKILFYCYIVDDANQHVIIKETIE